jgi:hypothetical protein
VSALEAYRAARATGVLLWLEGNRVQYLVTTGELPVAILANLRQYRAELLELLREQPICRPCGRRQHEPDVVCSPNASPTWVDPDPRYPIRPAYVPMPDESNGSRLDDD